MEQYAVYSGPSRVWSANNRVNPFLVIQGVSNPTAGAPSLGSALVVAGIAAWGAHALSKSHRTRNASIVGVAAALFMLTRSSA